MNLKPKKTEKDKFEAICENKDEDMEIGYR